MTSRLLLLLLGLSTAACGRGADVMAPFFLDPVVEAPVRTLDIAVLAGRSCDDVLSASHQAIAAGSDVLLHRVTTYPLPPADAELSELPLDQPLTFDIAAYDSELVQVGRGCGLARLSPDDPQTISVELRALPACSEPPSQLDLTILLDTSISMGFADPDQVHIQVLLDTVLDPVSVYPGTTFSLTTFGHGNKVQELVSVTSSLTQVRRALVALNNVNQGDTLLFDGLSYATSMLRARAVCGRRPVLLAMASDSDRGSTKRFEDAQVGLFANPADATDDLFMFGVALSDPGYKDLADLIPEGAIGRVGGATSRQLRDLLVEARATIAALVTPD